MNLLEVSEDDKAVVRKQLELTEEDIKRDVAILREWMKKQTHLPQVQDDAFFENFLVRNKGRVERVKECIDCYYTVKSAWCDVYKDIHNARPSKLSIDVVPIFKLTKSLERIIYVRFRKNSGPNFVIFDALRLLMAELEILRKYDYSAGIHMIMDMTEFQMDLLKLMTPVIVKKGLTAMPDVFSYRLGGIHFYQPPSWISLFLNMLKPVLKTKIYERIYLHNDLNSMLKHISKETLPSDFGGEQPSIAELNDQWENLIISHKKYLEDVEKTKSDESLRVGKCQFNLEMFGVDGTFKKLNID